MCLRPHLRLLPAAIALTAPAWCLAQASFTPSLSEYNWSSTVNQLHMRGIHNQGILGQGVTVALLDTGLNLANPEFVRNSRVLTPYNAVNGSQDVTDTINHGTHVAGIIAAGGNGTGMYGVAPMANLLMIKVFNGGTASATSINNGLDHAIGQGARVINMSFGTTTPLGDAGLRRAASTNQAVLVVAAGNEGGLTPNWPGRYAREDWANGTMLVVGAVDASGRLASFSNKAGDVAGAYLVAPGVNVLSSYGSSYGYMTGTSMAAPAVSGAAALITGYWPYLRANQVAAILLNTADDLGAPGVDAVYGHGLLNVNRALAPIGRYTYRASNGYTVTVPLATKGVALRQPTAVTPSAFAGLRTDVFDDYGRNYRSDEGQALQVRSTLTADMVMGRSEQATTLTTRTDGLGNRWTLQSVPPQASVMRTAPQGVMSPLSAGVQPTATTANDGAASVGVAQWQSAEGWGWSLGNAGLSAASLGVMGSPLGSNLPLNAGTSAVLANPLTALSPAHRFAVLNWAPAPQWQARLAALQPQVPTGYRGPAGQAVLAEAGLTGERATLNLSLGQLSERGLLGGYSHAGLGLDQRSRTLGLQLSGAWQLGRDWLALASWSDTRTASPQASGLLLSGSAVRANAMGIGLARQRLWQAQDQLSVSWLAPLKARSGTYRYSVVEGVDKAGQPMYGEQQVNLGQGAREWQADVRYAWRTDDHATAGQWRATLTVRVHPDHDAQAPSQVAGGVRYQQTF